MKLNFNAYKDKVYACWVGKNIGGTMGGPYEGVRKTLDIQGFATKQNEVLPNDDLDLQLIWLHAVEFEGPRNITAEVLGEYWLSFITGYWNEYGIARLNMEKGVKPPVCGDMRNEWKHSNGAWIRTEVWATLAPGYPDLAVRYAIEDAKVDHGMGEGTYAAAFVAALESAAFVISDVRKLIEIGLSKIPAESRMAQSVRLVMQCYDEGKTWLEARNAVLEANADIGDGWFQAPSNVAYVVLGILYGGGDFKKSMITAINCGDDTDCTAGTVGSILGIVYGTAGLPKDWCEYMGDDIVTGTINTCLSWPRITTCTQLTEKVVSLAPSVLRFNQMNAAKVELVDGKDEYTQEELDKLSLPYGKNEETDAMRASLFSMKENTFQTKFGYATAIVSYENGTDIAPNEEKKISVKIINNVKAYGNKPNTIRIKVWLPEGFTANKTEFDVLAPHWTPVTADCISEKVEITVKAGENLQATNKVLLEIGALGRYTQAYIPVIFLNR